MTKGESVQLVKGKYAGLEGWIDTSHKKKPKSCFVYVIVCLDKEGDEGRREKATWVKAYLICTPFPKVAKIFEQAALMQHKDMEKAMIDLAYMFAQIGLVDNMETVRLFDIKLSCARVFQHKLGSKAWYCNVLFKVQN